jgi:hypothetical protein
MSSFLTLYTAFREYISIFCCTERNSAEWFGTELREFSSILVPRNGIPSCFLFRRRVRNRIMGVNLYFLVHGTVFRVVFSSAEGFGTEFRDFLFRGTTGIPSEITICSVYSVFRGIIFLSEIPNPSHWWCALFIYVLVVCSWQLFIYVRVVCSWQLFIYVRVVCSWQLSLVGTLCLFPCVLLQLSAVTGGALCLFTCVLCAAGSCHWWARSGVKTVKSCVSSSPVCSSNYPLIRYMPRTENMPSCRLHGLLNCYRTVMIDIQDSTAPTELVHYFASRGSSHRARGSY